MKRVLLFACFVGCVPPSAYAADTWVATLPDLSVACASDPVAADDADAVASAFEKFDALWNSGLIVPGPHFVAAAAEGTLRVCALSPSHRAPSVAIVETVPAGPALVTWCSTSDATACRNAFDTKLGTSWHGRRWSVPRLVWRTSGDTASASAPARDEVERLATGGAPLLAPTDASLALTMDGEIEVAVLGAEDAARLAPDLTGDAQ